jgi:hypothetical protein
MSVSSVKDSSVKEKGKPDHGKRWAALDSRLERLANATDRVVDTGDSDRACDLKVAS